MCVLPSVILLMAVKLILIFMGAIKHGESEYMCSRRTIYRVYPRAKVWNKSERTKRKRIKLIKRGRGL